MSTLRMPCPDAALPALAKVLALGLAAIVPVLAADDVAWADWDPKGRRNEILVRAHKPGRHATLEARGAKHRFAILIYAERPEAEAELHEALAAEGLTGGPGARVPRLLARHPELPLIAVEWLDGPTLSELIARGEGRRAGELAAAWMERAASISLTQGKSFGVDHLLYRAEKCTAEVVELDAKLGAIATKLLDILETTAPDDGECRLVHAAFHARNIIDLGDGPGAIDWHQFGQGPPEVEAGMFLASVSVARASFEPNRAAEAGRAEAAFLERTAPLLDASTLGWHRAAALFWRARRMLTHRRDGWSERMHVLLQEATLHAHGGRKLVD